MKKFIRMGVIMYFFIYYFTPSEEGYEIIKAELAKQQLT